ncbi:MAG TPA: hypothetical protein VK457_03120 [Chloroflexota bacterium]|jgi:hypothetical protein|nr:hypothetical protein [Chloroflexota bacterium]
MWVRIGLIVGRIALRLLIRLAPFLAIAGAALVRRYRWPIYYRVVALKPAKLNLSAVPGIVLGSVGGLALMGVALYLIVTVLAPHR